MSKSLPKKKVSFKGLVLFTHLFLQLSRLNEKFQQKMENNHKLMEIKNPRSKNKMKFKQKTQILDLISAGNFIILNIMKLINLPAF